MQTFEIDEDGFNKASKRGGDYFFAPEDMSERAFYTVKITDVKGQMSKNKKGRMFIVETEVLETSHPKEQPTGSTPASVCMLDENEPAVGNMRDFVATCFGISFDACKIAHCNAGMGDAKPLNGSIMRVQAQHFKSKKGNTYTKLSWKLLTMSDKVKAIFGVKPEPTAEAPQEEAAA